MEHISMDQDQKNAGRGPFQDFGRKVEEQAANAAPRVEAEVKKVIAYLNDEVVPQVRQNSFQALRTAAEQLRRLAERLEHR